MINPDHFLSALYGQGIGDALGAPIEGFLPTLIQQHLEKLKKPYTYEDIQKIHYQHRGKYRDLVGLHTDDTQYMLVLLDSLDWNPEKDYYEYNCLKSIKLFKQMFNTRIKGSKSGILRGTGSNARQAFKNMTLNLSLNRIGVNSAGIGSAMRIGPPSLLFKENEKDLNRFIIESSILTHIEPRGIAAAYAQAKMCIECYEIAVFGYFNVW